MLLIAEILGVVLALSGAFILSQKPQKTLGAIAWILFICADTLHATVYFNNEQNGMVFNQIVGTFLCTMGLTQYLLNNESGVTKNITKFMFVLFSLFITSGIIMALFNIVNYSLHNFEWMIALFSISGTTLMASRHKNAKYVYVIWLICDSVFLFLCLMNKQYAIAVLRITFICINYNGLKNWFMPNGISIENFIYTVKTDIKVK